MLRPLRWATSGGALLPESIEVPCLPPERPTESAGRSRHLAGPLEQHRLRPLGDAALNQPLPRPPSPGIAPSAGLGAE